MAVYGLMLFQTTLEGKFPVTLCACIAIWYMEVPVSLVGTWCCEFMATSDTLKFKLVMDPVVSVPVSNAFK